MGRRSEIDQALETLLDEKVFVTSSDLSRRTGRTRQALSHHIKRWLDEGRLVRVGRGRGTRYERAAGSPAFETSHSVAGLGEESVWCEVRQWLESRLEARSSGFGPILYYAITEIVNNAIEHSDSDRVWVRAGPASGRVRVEVRDTGIGAFERLRGMLGLDDHLHALQEMVKGKVTTQPENHTGQGLFFTSKMVDRFSLTANGMRWMVDPEVADQAVFQTRAEPGTSVSFEVAWDTDVRAEDVFARYSTDFEFDKTRIVLRLFEHGVRFVSRSEAKRLLHGLQTFRVVVLDFQGVEGVGQGFVDEVFRVWSRAHPEVELCPENMNDAVAFMVRRGWLDVPDSPGGASRTGPDTPGVREELGHPSLERLHFDPAIRFGEPVIRGTRITVSEVVGLLSTGMGRRQLARDLGLRVVDVEAALAYAARAVEREAHTAVGAEGES